MERHNRTNHSARYTEFWATNRARTTKRFGFTEPHLKSAEMLKCICVYRHLAYFFSVVVIQIYVISFEFEESDKLQITSIPTMLLAHE